MQCIARKILHIAIAASSQSCDFFTTYNASLTYKLIANPYWLLSFLTFSAFGKRTQKLVNQICEDLIRNVTNCDLDYKMHQTPFSLFFSIRKKLTKNSKLWSLFPKPSSIRILRRINLRQTGIQKSVQLLSSWNRSKETNKKSNYFC